MEQSNQFLATEPVGKLMGEYALPCIISLLVGALYNIVDQIFIANASYLGSFGNAANTVVFPLTVVALAIAVMVGNGCCAYVSICLGKGETKKAEKSIGNTLTMVTISSVLLTVAYFVFQTEIIAMFGGTVNEETFSYAGEYFFYISIGIPFYMFGQAVNNMLRKYGRMDIIFGQAQYAQIPIAVIGIVMKFFQIVISIVVGMAAGCIPIVGYNIGADNKLRVRDLFTKLLMAEALLGAVAFLLVQVFPKQLISVFGAANESAYYTEFAIKAFRIYLCMVLAACVNKACFIFLQAMGKAVESMVLSMIREVVFGVGLVILFPIFWGLDGILVSMPISDGLTFLVVAVLIAHTYRDLYS